MITEKMVLLGLGKVSGIAFDPTVLGNIREERSLRVFPRQAHPPLTSQ